MASDIPDAVRAAVLERDQWCCRLCGAGGHGLHLHHIVYRSQGGRHVVENLITLHYSCHDIVHSNKPLWMPILQFIVAERVHVTARQILRQARALESDTPSR